MVRLPFRSPSARESARQYAERLRKLLVRPEVETLDDRILPSVTTSLSPGILGIWADDLNNSVQLVNAGADVQVREGGTLVSSHPAADVQVAVFQHGASTNTFTNQTAVRSKELRL